MNNLFPNVASKIRYVTNLFITHLPVSLHETVNVYAYLSVSILCNSYHYVPWLTMAIRSSIVHSKFIYCTLHRER